MPILVLCGATCCLLSRPALAERSLPRAFGLTTFITLTAAVFAVLPNKDSDGSFCLGVLEEPARFWALFGVTVLGIVLFGLLWHFCRRKRQWSRILLAGVLGFSLVYGSLHLSLTKYAQWDVDGNLIAETYDSADAVAAALPDDAFYRIDAYGAHNNLGLWFDRSCLQFFNSTVAPSIMEFYPAVGVKRDVNSKPDAANYALRGLLSVRYTLTARDKVSDWEKQALPGWTKYAETDAYLIYENENWVPMGFTYDHYVTEETYDATPEDRRELLMLKGIVLTEQQIEEWGDMLTELPADQVSYTTAAYEADCADRAALTCDTFQYTNTGFTATISTSRDVPVFFSIPYESGWSAYVNGEEVDIEQVNVGFMAIRVNAGTDVQIEFVYETPGLLLGA